MRLTHSVLVNLRHFHDLCGENKFTYETFKVLIFSQHLGYQDLHLINTSVNYFTQLTE